MTLYTTISVDSSGAYTASPPSQTATASNTVLEYGLDAQSNQTWQITGLSDTDPYGQLSNEQILNDGQAIQVTDANTVAETFSVFLALKKRATGEAHRIDPTVTNEPPA